MSILEKKQVITAKTKRKVSRLIEFKMNIIRRSFNRIVVINMKYGFIYSGFNAGAILHEEMDRPNQQ